ncbi:MAG: nickel-dependent hydrogenase large [Geobacteraceae bacterium]|nr:MAG: nickel-dependent hydrogenase large [Geobacteraceae bacterium]
MSSVIDIRPLTRVEGHGRVSVFLDGKRVEGVRLTLTESPRLFEALLVGKGFEEVPAIICRICSLCSSVHRITSLMAVEKALGIGVTEQAQLHRELILNGGHIQSHALHLFCLVLPDLFGVCGFTDLAEKAPEELKRGLRIKAAGNLIQETVGGRLIHPVTLIPGGMGKPVGREGLLKLKEALEAILPDAANALELFSTFTSPCSALSPSSFMAVEPGSAPPLFGERLITGDGEGFSVDDYRSAFREEVSPDTHAKKSLVNGKSVTVGALARLNLGMELAPRAAAAFERCRDRIVGADIRANNLAQSVELIHAVERSLEIIDILLDRGFEREKPEKICPHPQLQLRWSRPLHCRRRHYPHRHQSSPHGAQPSGPRPVAGRSG